jgi:hypothetical protein
MRNVTVVFVSVMLVVLSGCAKISDTQTKELKGLDPSWELIIPAFKSGVKVEAKVEADGKVMGCLVPADHVEAAGRDQLNGRKPKDALDSVESGDNFTLNATFPANQEGRLLVAPAVPAGQRRSGNTPVKVKVTIVGR